MRARDRDKSFNVKYNENNVLTTNVLQIPDRKEYNASRLKHDYITPTLDE